MEMSAMDIMAAFCLVAFPVICACICWIFHKLDDIENRLEMLEQLEQLEAPHENEC